MCRSHELLLPISLGLRRLAGGKGKLLLHSLCLDFCSFISHNSQSFIITQILARVVAVSESPFPHILSTMALPPHASEAEQTLPDENVIIEDSQADSQEVETPQVVAKSPSMASTGDEDSVDSICKHLKEQSQVLWLILQECQEMNRHLKRARTDANWGKKWGLCLDPAICHWIPRFWQPFWAILEV